MKTKIEFDTNICQQCEERTKDYEYFCESCKVEQELKSATEQNSVFLEENLRLTSQLNAFVDLNKNQKATIARLQNETQRLHEMLERIYELNEKDNDTQMQLDTHDKIKEICFSANK